MIKTDRKKVSIVLPVYNGEDHLADAIESVLCQTYRNWELIIVNDHSTDNTAQILEEYAQKDSRIRVIDNPANLKLPRSLNVGFEVATGSYYTWTSDDNLYKEHAIWRMVDVLEHNKDIDMVYADFTDIDREGNGLRHVEQGRPEGLLMGNAIGACFLYTRRIAQKVGYYDPDLFLAEDYDYWIRIWRAGRMLHIDEDLYYYRRHEGSLSETKKDLIGMQTYRAMEKNFLFLYAAAGTRKKRHALVEQMSSWKGDHRKKETWRMFMHIDRAYVYKDRVKTRLRGTCIWKMLRWIYPRAIKFTRFLGARGHIRAISLADDIFASIKRGLVQPLWKSLRHI